ncbi:hypothetical protein [uncultured Jannaschia sp.]|uniref:hypothetical protein n=1 Tax=uncultured Jannaschia sp. TaxID=293347 RepID=UPI0026198ABC|nr:hypothetical protein [uncultured Jannaschia sp.]
MRLFLHIGMAKTGSTAIQGALARSRNLLARQNAAYIGKQPVFAGDSGKDIPSYVRLSRQDPATQATLAEAFHAELAARHAAHGTATFVASREGIVEWDLLPFVQRLGDLMDVRCIVYLRPARPWLSSAYVQRALRNKSMPGPIPSFDEYVPELMGYYGRVKTWAETLGPGLLVREYRSDDIVADFAEATGLELRGAERRIHSTSEDAEILLRTWFNSRFEAANGPAAFQDAVTPHGPLSAPRIDDMVARHLDHSSVDTHLANQSEMLDYFRETHGIDLDPDSAPLKPGPDRAALRDRMLDMLIELQMQNALRIFELEKQLAKANGPTG